MFLGEPEEMFRIDKGLRIPLIQGFAQVGPGTESPARPGDD